MNRQDGFDRLLAEFGESIGISGMAFDDDGLCHIRVDDEYPVTFRRDDENHTLVLVGLLAETLPAQLDRELVCELLAMGCEPLREHGASIGLEPHSGTMVLHRTVPLARLTLPGLEEMLGRFILMQRDWSIKLGGLGGILENGPERPFAASQQDPLASPERPVAASDSSRAKGSTVGGQVRSAAPPRPDRFR